MRSEGKGIERPLKGEVYNSILLQFDNHTLHRANFQVVLEAFGDVNYRRKNSKVNLRHEFR